MYQIFTKEFKMATYFEIENAARSFAKRSKMIEGWNWETDKVQLKLLLFIEGFECDCPIGDAMEISETIISDAIHGEWVTK